MAEALVWHCNMLIDKVICGYFQFDTMPGGSVYSAGINYCANGNVRWLCPGGGGILFLHIPSLSGSFLKNTVKLECIIVKHRQGRFPQNEIRHKIHNFNLCTHCNILLIT